MPVKQKLILLADDDQEDLELLQEALNACDPETRMHSVLNGRLAVEYLENIKDDELPCLIVLDYNMPELNGAEILKALKQNSRYNSIPKIIWSTSGSELYKNLCLESGAHDYMIKPSNIRELENVAKRLLSYAVV